MLKLRELGYTYPRTGQAVLQDINIDFGDNEFVAVLGKNGSGKSTLGRLLNGLLLPTTGTVEVDGLYTEDPSALRTIHKRVGLLSANPDNQLIGATVEEDVAFGPGNLNVCSEEINKRVDTALKLVSMEDYKKYPPNLLSGGQKQKVCLAGLLAMQPRYMVLDEPTAMLDATARREILASLGSLHKNPGLGIIFISNRLEDVVLADRIVVLDQGRISLEGSPAEILTRVEQLQEFGIEPIELQLLKQSLQRAGLIGSSIINDPLDLVNELCRLQ